MESNRFPSSTAKLRNYKAGLVTPAQPTSSRTISLCSSTLFPTAKKRKNRETDLKENKRGSFQLTGRLSSFPFGSMVELDWPVPVVTREHLQNLVS
jgi:hypothetical protein